MLNRQNYTDTKLYFVGGNKTPPFATLHTQRIVTNTQHFAIKLVCNLVTQLNYNCDVVF